MKLFLICAIAYFNCIIASNDVYEQMKQDISAVTTTPLSDAENLQQKSLSFVDKSKMHIKSTGTDNAKNVVTTVSTSIPGLTSGDAIKVTQSVLNIAATVSLIIPPPIGPAASAVFGLVSALLSFGAEKDTTMQDMMDQAVDEIKSALIEMQEISHNAEFENAKVNCQMYQSELITFATYTGVDECVPSVPTKWDLFYSQMETMRQDDRYFATAKAYIESANEDNVESKLKLLHGFCYMATLREITLLSAMGVMANQIENCRKPIPKALLETVAIMYGNLKNAHDSLLDIVAEVLDDVGDNFFLAKQVKRLDASDPKYSAINAWLEREIEGVKYKDEILFLFSSEGTYGEWSPVKMCSPDTYVYRIDQQIELTHISDAAGLVNIEMVCNGLGKSVNKQNFGLGYDWGDWNSHVKCVSGEYLKSLENCIHPYQGNGDDLGQIAVWGRCTDESYHTFPIEGGGRYCSDYSGDNEAKCPIGFAICGMAARVEPYQGAGGGADDDTAISELAARCCDLNDWNHQIIIAPHNNNWFASLKSIPWNRLVFIIITCCVVFMAVKVGNKD